MMQGVEDDAMLKRKSYLLAAAVIAVVSVAPAFAQQTGKIRVVSDEVRERCRAQVRAIGIRGMKRRRHRREATQRDHAAMSRKRRQAVSRPASSGWRPQ
jgi:uncharacterized protein (DUF2141 family)